MATAPLSAGQMKELTAAIVEAIPSDLPSDVAQSWIGRKRELGSKIRTILNSYQIVGVSDISLPEVYKALGIGKEYFEAVGTLTIPSESNLWAIPIVRGATCNKVVVCLRKLGVDVYTYYDDLDKNVPNNDRDPNRDGSYVVAFRRTVEADEENKSLSANQLKKRNHKGITLLERLLLELGYFLATGKHLDEKNWTLCSGSRDSDGGVPRVCWSPDDRGVCVGWYDPGDSRGYLRSRSVQFSLPA